MQSFTLGSSKIEVFEPCVFDIVTTQNDHSSYVKHVLGRIYVFLTLFGYQVRGGGGGGLLGDWYIIGGNSHFASLARVVNGPKQG